MPRTQTLRGTIMVPSFSLEQPPKNWPDLSGQTGIVTGSYTTLGYECAERLLSNNLSHLIITACDWKQGRERVSKLSCRFPDAYIEVWLLHMLSYESVEQFARKCDSLDQIDFVIITADIVCTDFTINPSTQHETTFQVNYLTTILLTMLLLPILKLKHGPKRPGRITLVCSSLALAAKFPDRKANALLAALDDPQPWTSPERYAATKLLLLMFLIKLKDHVDPREVVLNIADPDFHQEDPFDDLRPCVVLNTRAETVVHAAIAQPACTHGSWVSHWGVRPFPSLMYTVDGKELMERLWTETIIELQGTGAGRILAPLRYSPLRLGLYME
ncbi:hypothetical protein BJX99DRAFT_266587 [Aspergillus californicus]